MEGEAAGAVSTVDVVVVAASSSLVVPPASVASSSSSHDASPAPFADHTPLQQQIPASAQHSLLTHESDDCGWWMVH